MSAFASVRAEAESATLLANHRGLVLPVRQLSVGLDGVALLARVEGSGALVELRYAQVASSDPPRWQEIHEAARVYQLVEQPGLRRLLREEQVDGLPVLVFEGFLERTLDSRLANRPLASDEVWQLLQQLAPALAAAHLMGFVHGQLAPSSVLLCDDGRVMLDFPWLDVGRRTSRFDVGCAPPEAAAEPLDARSDVYSLGALLHVALTAAPYGESELSSGPLSDLIYALTQADRDARPSMAEVCGALQRRKGKAAGSGTSNVAAPVPLEFSLPAPPAEDLGPGSRLGRFEIEAKIGEGGMGRVYRAIDRANGQRAALKVLRAELAQDANAWPRFRKEARILGQIRSPYIANLLEMNRDGGIDFIALEFVEGVDLQKWLDERGRCSERDALAIITDVARGLSDAHARGIVHRDIKPHNIMIDDESNQLRVKLCDFGIARSLSHREGTMAYTEHGAVLGTPAFMAPEQCCGEAITPATDIYALGITLFQLVAGRLPFQDPEPTKLLFAHVGQAAPVLEEIRSDVSQTTSQLVARMLKKAPEERFVDASALLEELERMAAGAATSVAVHPLLPMLDPKRIVHHVFEWHLESASAALWPFVSNTDRLNRAVGMQAPKFVRTPSSTAGVETNAENRIGGVNLRWREHPFEWIERKRWSVLRVFAKGVMHWFVVELLLQDKPGGGSLLRYTMTLEPRHWLGRLLVAIEMRWKQRPALSRTFARIDGFASAQVLQVPGSDAFEAPTELSAPQRAALDRALEKLRLDRVDTRILDALAAFCTHAPAQQITGLRPLAFAHSHGLDPDRLVDACLRGTQHGLFLLLWQVLCPLCRIPSGFVESLRAVQDHGHCPSCNVQFPIDFAQSLELIFRVSPTVRESELRTYCVGGPAFAPHVVAQLRLAAGERLNLELTLDAGSYKIRSPQLQYDISLQVSDAARSGRGRAVFSAATPPADLRILVTPRVQELSIHNQLEHELIVRVERTAAREDALTAARAACLASFRELFPGEVLTTGRLAALGRTAFLVSHVREQRKLLQLLGDARAFELVVAHLRELAECVSAEGGALIKTSSGNTLCAFDSAAAAVRAALLLRTREGQAANDQRLDVRLLVHQGSAVAATLDGRLDYFGDTIESALELVSEGPARQILLSQAVAEDRHVIADVTGAGHSLQLLGTQVDHEFGVVIVPVIQPR